MLLDELIFINLFSLLCKNTRDEDKLNQMKHCLELGDKILPMPKVCSSIG